MDPNPQIPDLTEHMNRLSHNDSQKATIPMATNVGTRLKPTTLPCPMDTLSQWKTPKEADQFFWIYPSNKKRFFKYKLIYLNNKETIEVRSLLPKTITVNTWSIFFHTSWAVPSTSTSSPPKKVRRHHTGRGQCGWDRGSQRKRMEVVYIMHSTEVFFSSPSDLCSLKVSPS